MKLKQADLPKVRRAILAVQGYKCPLCRQPLGPNTKKKPALDHDHSTGYIRGVLCVNCNGKEGKVWNAARAAAGKGNSPISWLLRLLHYYKEHDVPQWSNDTRKGLIYPAFKSKNEKRIATLAKAKRRRQARKLVQC